MMRRPNLTSARTLRLAATLALLALAAALPAGAQTFVAAADCGKAGEAFVSETLSGSLAREGSNESLHLLNPAFTGAGYRWDVEYSMVRTREEWPWWAAYARIDVLSADGETLGRVWSRSFKGTVTGTVSFHGEESEEARPHRLRFTFSQPHTFPFAFTARLTARPVIGANPGGARRGAPEYMAIGSPSAPNFVCGDVVLRTEYHRFMLFGLQSGQELRARLQPGVLRPHAYAHFGFGIWDLGHRSLGVRDTYVRAGKEADVVVFRNADSEKRFVIVAMKSKWGLRDHRIGFYSPQGVSPAPGEAAPPSSLDPFVTTARVYSVQDVAAGATARFALPATGERFELRLRVQKPVFLAPAPGVFCTIRVIGSSGKLLTTGHLATDPWGHEPTEYFCELTGPDAAGGRLEVTTRYNASVCTLDASAFARR